jgi:hypothetical protein
MLAALISVLALAGAPQATSVTCNPQVTNGGELGVTFPAYLTIVDGKVINGPLALIVLGGEACGALLYTSASPAERAAIRRLNPSVDFHHLVGEGLQVALHEAEHVALNSSDECLVEKTTRAKIDGLISSIDPTGAGADELAATTSDAGLPPAYHGC